MLYAHKSLKLNKFKLCGMTIQIGACVCVHIFKYYAKTVYAANKTTLRKIFKIFKRIIFFLSFHFQFNNYIVQLLKLSREIVTYLYLSHNLVKLKLTEHYRKVPYQRI